MKIGLLFVTLLLSVSLSVGMWIVGAVPFDLWTSALHVASIYIGISGVLIYQNYRREKDDQRDL